MSKLFSTEAIVRRAEDAHRAGRARRPAQPGRPHRDRRRPHRARAALLARHDDLRRHQRDPAQHHRPAPLRAPASDDAVASGEWSLPAVHDVVAAAVPDRDMVVCGRRPPHLRRGGRADPLAGRRSSRRDGSASSASGPSSSGGRCGQDAVALVLHNGAEYLEAMLGAYRARAVPFNVNQHYRPAEIGRAARRPRRPRRRLPPRARPAASAGRVRPRRDVLLVDVDDGSGVAPLPGQHDLRGRRSRTPVDRAAARRRRPTTSTWSAPAAPPGRPEGGALAPGRHLRVGHGRRRGRHRRVDRRRRGRPTAGGAVVRRAAAHARRRAVDGVLRRSTAAPRSLLHDDSQPLRRRATILELAERERVALMSIVGDAYAAPARRGAAPPALRPRRRCSMHRHRRRGHERAAQGGAARAAARTLTDRRRLRRVGDRRHGVRGPDAGRAAPRASAPAAGATVRLRRPDALPRAGRRRDRLDRPPRAGCPLGYLGDREQTEATFPIVDGERRRHPRRPGPAARRRLDPHARPRLDGGEHRRREGVRRGGRGGAAPPPRRRRRAVVGRPVGPLRPGGRRGRRARGRARRSTRRRCASSSPPTSPGSRRRARSSCATRSAATPTARPTTGGPGEHGRRRAVDVAPGAADGPRRPRPGLPRLRRHRGHRPGRGARRSRPTAHGSRSSGAGASGPRPPPPSWPRRPARPSSAWPATSPSRARPRTWSPRRWSSSAGCGAWR